MSDDKPNVSTTDPDDWRTFVKNNDARMRAILGGPWNISGIPPHTIDDCRHAVYESGLHLDDIPPAGLTAAQEIRLRLAEALLSAERTLADPQEMIRDLAPLAYFCEHGDPDGVWMHNTAAKFAPNVSPEPARFDPYANGDGAEAT